MLRARSLTLALAAVALASITPAATAAPKRPTCTAGVTAPGDPFGTDSCDGVRPGTQLKSGTELCTFGFLFRGSDNRRYAATAGHCAFATDPDRTVGKTVTWQAGIGPVVRDGADKQVGRFAYATLNGEFQDFALVRLDTGVPYTAQMCHFGGPTGITTAVHNDDMQVHHYGRGVGLGDKLPARTGDMFFGLYRADYVYFYGAAAEGDSGSPVITDSGAAVGLITDLTTPFTGNVGVNRLADHLRASETALKIKLTLLTAPLL
jgi:hypothetical protein